MRGQPRLLLALAAVSAALALAAPAAVGQHHTAEWSYIGNGVMPEAIGKIDAAGKMTTVLTSNALPFFSLSGAWDFDDQTYVVPIIPYTAPGSLVRVSEAGTILNTIQVLNKSPQQGGGALYDVILDQDGDYVMAEGQLAGPGGRLIRVSRSGLVSVVYQGAPLGFPKSVLTDIDSGDYLLAEFNNGRVFRIARDGSSITSVGTLTVSTSQITRPVGSGDLFTGGAVPPGVGALIRMDSHGREATLQVPGLSGCGGLHADRSSAANPRLAVAGYEAVGRQGLYFVDSNTLAVSTLYSHSNISYGYNQVFPRREVATIKRGPGLWEIPLHFSGEAGNGYLVGLSLSGVRPGFALPDGRHLWLNVDNLTWLGVLGGLGPVFRNPAGTLNAAGRASAFLDVSGLPPLSGLRVWAVAMTLDPSAPLGLRTIADPLILVL